MIVCETFIVFYSHQHYLVDQCFSDPMNNPYPMHYSSCPCSNPYVTYSFSITKLMYTLFPLSKSNYTCGKDLSFTEFSSPLCLDSNIHNSRRFPMALWTDSCPNSGIFMFIQLTVHLLYSLPTTIFIRRVDYACAPQLIHIHTYMYTQVCVYIYVYVYVYAYVYVYTHTMRHTQHIISH